MKTKVVIEKAQDMFEEIAFDSAKMLMFLFWVALGTVMISGVMWLRSSNK